MKKNFSLRDDTAEVYGYTRKAFSYLTKSPDYELIKAYIDSAEMVCKERNIEKAGDAKAPKDIDSFKHYIKPFQE